MDKPDELQKQLAEDPSNSKVYETVFNLLQRTPSETLDADLSKRVVKRIQKREKSRRGWFYFWSVMGTLFCALSTLVIILYYFGLDDLPRLMDATGWAVFIGVSLVVIQYFDRKLIHKKRLQVI